MTHENEAAMQSADEMMPIEPNWEVLKLLLDQTMKWMVYADEYGAAELEPITLTHNMLFGEFETEEKKVECIAYRVTSMLEWVEGLHDLLYPHPKVETAFSRYVAQEDERLRGKQDDETC